MSYRFLSTSLPLMLADAGGPTLWRWLVTAGTLVAAVVTVFQFLSKREEIDGAMQGAEKVFGLLKNVAKILTLGAGILLGGWVVVHVMGSGGGAVTARPSIAEGNAVKSRPVFMVGSTAGQPVQVTMPGGTVLTLRYCPAGTFTMGSPVTETGRLDDEDQVTVRLSQGFWMGQTELTQAQWCSVMGSNPSAFQGDDLPVEQVSWDDAQAFIGKLNQAIRLSAGWMFALPTEAQWEYACRAGTQSAFALEYGNVLMSEEANFDGNRPYGTTSTGPSLNTTLKVGSYSANAWGLYDMHGNVWEWCMDAAAYGVRSKLVGGTDPIGTSGHHHMIRGGGWGWSADVCRSAFRSCSSGYSYEGAYRTRDLGFRLAAVPAAR